MITIYFACMYTKTLQGAAGCIILANTLNTFVPQRPGFFIDNLKLKVNQCEVHFLRVWLTYSLKAK